MIARPLLSAVKDNIVALRNHSLELDVFARVAAGRFFEIGYEPFLAVCNTRIVLNVVVPDVSFDGLARSALIEHDVVKGDHVPLVTFQIGHCRSNVSQRGKPLPPNSCDRLPLPTKPASRARPPGVTTPASNAANLGTDLATYTRETPGMSAFALEDGLVYHTYSAYARGLDGFWGMYQWLDRAPRGRNESLFVGAGDLRGSVWYRRHDEYDKR